MREQTQFETMPLGIRIGDLSHEENSLFDIFDVHFPFNVLSTKHLC